jgi:hypothetical protein
LVTLRLANVYDLSSKILLLKFAKPDNKQQLLIENGFRCHLTDFARTTAAAPSAFVARLRKYLKTRRLTAVTQVGTDRILEFQFSDGQYRMFLEFFAVCKAVGGLRRLLLQHITTIGWKLILGRAEISFLPMRILKSWRFLVMLAREMDKKRSRLDYNILWRIDKTMAVFLP